MPRIRPLLVLLILCCWVPALAAAASEAPDDAARVHSSAEAQLLSVLNLAQKGEYDTAINDLSDLIEIRPNFRLAQLVYGELMVARSGRSLDPAISTKPCSTKPRPVGHTA